MKRSRWLPLRNRSHLESEQALKLEELLAAKTVYVLKDQLKEL